MDDGELAGATAAGLLCDFVGGAFGHRLRAGVGRSQPLPRAVGLRPGRRPRIVDATAGLGRDAFLLAALGLEVTLIERSPEIHAALADGLARAAAAGPPHADIVGRMTLVHGDARSHLAHLSPDVVVVDPMHPPRRSAALVKKAMRDVRSLVGADDDAADLVAVALTAATNRVVLKWPLHGAPLEGLRKPDHSILTKTLRYDVFLTGHTAA
jgi:16S rRNA (guanine1516-N2)-methyltransferase